MQSIASNNTTFLVSFVYGLNSYVDRRALWSDLLSLSPMGSWCLLGDFNFIKNLCETNQDDSWDIGMDEFRDCILSIGVDDVRGIGPLYTWWNNQTTRPVHKKLDRVLGNSDWFSYFSHSLVTYAPRGLSDHSLILLNTGVQTCQSRRQFQFFNHMLLLDGFKDCVSNAWNTTVYGNPFYVYTEKLKRTKKALFSLNKLAGNLFGQTC